MFFPLSTQKSSSCQWMAWSCNQNWGRHHFDGLILFIYWQWCCSRSWRCYLQSRRLIDQGFYVCQQHSQSKCCWVYNFFTSCFAILLTYGSASVFLLSLSPGRQQQVSIILEIAAPLDYFHVVQMRLWQKSNPFYRVVLLPAERRWRIYE